MARHLTADGRDRARCDLAPFGLDDEAEALYRVVLRCSGEALSALSDRTGVPEAALSGRLRLLLDLRLVRLVGDQVHAEPPDLALGRLIGERADLLQQEQDLLAAARTAVPRFVALHEHGPDAQWEPAPVEVIEPSDLVPAMESLLRYSTGELLFLRPDQYAVSSGQRMDQIVLAALHAGRRSRALYPTRIAGDVSDRVRARALAGERVRVAPVVPARLAIFGAEGAVITEHWESTVGRRLLVRQPALVRALTALFDAYWERAVVLPELGGPERPGHGAGRDGRDSMQGALLALLARGAKDEQVARVLGISLRTVRRRVAALMADLGAESRFQAGIEAVRRGLL